MMRIDARLPLRFGPLTSRQPNEAVLTDSASMTAEPAIRIIAEQAGYLMACACCTPRSAAARALADLFRQRATGQGALFRGVLAVVGADGETAVRTALATDPVVSARFKLAS